MAMSPPTDSYLNNLGDFYAPLKPDWHMAQVNTSLTLKPQAQIY
jgi:hypothetical protein